MTLPVLIAPTLLPSVRKAFPHFRRLPDYDLERALRGAAGHARLDGEVIKGRIFNGKNGAAIWFQYRKEGRTYHITGVTNPKRG